MYCTSYIYKRRFVFLLYCVATSIWLYICISDAVNIMRACGLITHFWMNHHHHERYIRFKRSWWFQSLGQWSGAGWWQERHQVENNHRLSINSVIQPNSYILLVGSRYSYVDYVRRGINKLNYYNRFKGVWRIP